MKKNNEEEFDAFLKETLKNIGTESPSAHFTDSVMAKVREVSEKAP